MALPIDTARELGQILEANPIPTFVVNTNSQITHWNRACELLTDIPAADMIGTDRHREAFYCQRRELLADLIVRGADTAELSALYGDKFKNSQRTRAGYEGEDFFPKLGENGKWLFFTAAPLEDANGDIVGAIETLQDITQRRLAEQAIRAGEARYRQLFESANDAIFVLKDGRIVDCNQKALVLFDASRKVLLGQHPLALSPEIQPNGAFSEDEVERKSAMVKQNVPLLFEWQFLRKNGSPFDAEVSLTRFWVSESPLALAIVRDITARKKMSRTINAREKELDEKRRYLETVNQALKAALDHREVEKRAVEENMLINLKRFVFPYIEELGKCQISRDAQAYLNIIDTNLNDIVSRLPKTIFSKYIDLTPTEIRIADFIRDGKNSKAVAHLMGLSPSSVQWHRKNIREKLGLTNKKVNLYVYLTSLTE
jgi:PAS domain S-box-containing protein